MGDLGSFDQDLHPLSIPPDLRKVAIPSEPCVWSGNLRGMLGYHGVFCFTVPMPSGATRVAYDSRGNVHRFMALLRHRIYVERVDGLCDPGATSSGGVESPAVSLSKGLLDRYLLFGFSVSEQRRLLGMKKYSFTDSKIAALPSSA